MVEVMLMMAPTIAPVMARLLSENISSPSRRWGPRFPTLAAVGGRALHLASGPSVDPDDGGEGGPQDRDGGESVFQGGHCGGSDLSGVSWTG